jgi:hypothetical protein
VQSADGGVGLGSRVCLSTNRVLPLPLSLESRGFLEHPMPRIGDYLNAIASAGLRLTACEEPCVTQESVAFELK